MSSKKGDYEIGYGKPPEHSRFQKGRSANPAGRPKGKTAPSPITKVLERKVTMTVDGKRGKVAVTEALMTRLVESAFKGDDKALRDVIRIAQQMETAKVRAAAARPPAGGGSGRACGWGGRRCMYAWKSRQRAAGTRRQHTEAVFGGLPLRRGGSRPRWRLRRDARSLARRSKPSP